LAESVIFVRSAQLCGGAQAFLRDSMSLSFASQRRLPERIARALPFATSLAVVTSAFAFLAWPWLSGAVTIPWDAKAQFQPELQFMAASLARGESPFWAPNVFAGWPQIADPQSLILSPFHLALAAFDATPSFRAVDFITFAYLFAGAVGMLLFFRDRGWHWAGAIAAALIFAFGGSAASRLQHTSEVVSLAYLPLALWLLARTLERASWRCGLAAGLLIALLASGRDQVALIGLYVIAGYVLFYWFDGPGRMARVKATFLPLFVCGATTVALALVPFVWSALLAADSNRPGFNLDYVDRGSLHPVHLLMLFFADLFGAADPKVEFWGPPSPAWRSAVGATNLFLSQNSGQIYCGILAAVLILGTGIARGAMWARDIRFFSVALVLALLYALGWYTPVFRLMFDVMPGVELFRRPSDATFTVGFLIAVISGYLIHRLLTDKAQKLWQAAAIEGAFVAVLVGIAVAVAWDANRVGVAVWPIETGVAFALGAMALLAAVRRFAPTHRALLGALVVAFVVFDLGWNNGPNESTGLPPSRYEALRPQTTDETVALLKTRLAATAAPDRRDRVELIGIAYHWPDVALAQGFDHLFGHNPLRLRDFALATGVGDTVAIPEQRAFAPLFPSYRSTFANLCGVRFIATGVPIERIDSKLHPGDLILIGRTKDAYIYENPRALPRVMVVHDYRLADFAALIRDGFPDVDPRRTVLLEHVPSITPGSPGADGTARIVRYANTEVDIEADAPTGGLLVMNDAWHPWWRVEVDGQPAELLKANVIFRAVALLPGDHRIHFAFEPLRGAWDELEAKALHVLRGGAKPNGAAVAAHAVNPESSP
jgi:hypothetical protein